MPEPPPSPHAPEAEGARVARRLAHLQDLVEGAGAGDIRPWPSGAFERDEFTPLEVGIALVLDDLKAALRENERANAELERRVAERTRELEGRGRDLQAAVDELRQQDRYKSDFLAAMSHELRTPLNAIIGYCELLQDHGADRLSKKHQRALESVLDAARHLLSLINDLLDLSKVSAGKMALEPGPLASRGALEAVRGMLQAQADRKGLQLVVEVSPQAEVAYGDARRVEQCLLNLASNAVKFTPAGGRVLLSALPHPEGVQFSVSDTGPGISHEDQKRLFREFVQLQDVTRREHGGTGLGLALTRRLVELHGGRVWVDSEVGKGAAFHMLLPVPQDAPRGREVLLVEDDPALRAAAAGWVRELGLRPVEAASAEAAMAYLSGNHPAAAVLDINLPGMSGLDLAREIRGRETTRGLPLLFMTAVHLPEAERLARGAYQGAWLPKGPSLQAALAGELRRLGLTEGARSPAAQGARR